MTVTWDKDLDENSVPHPGVQGFYIWDRVDKREITVSTLEVRGKQVILTLSEAVSATDDIIVSFRTPSVLSR